jgi:signal transduction histidine kinase
MHMERRRIERDLHDGAQQRLVSLAMDLGRARDRMESGEIDGARDLLVHTHEESKVILKELRDLVRGIHPAVLSDRGLDAAISAIAGRSSIPVEVDVDLVNRLPDEVEGTAYFFVVEALANIAKHSHASEAHVSISRNGNWLRVEIRDNGLGGADPSRGTGLAGLRDRIEALDGRMRVESRNGGGTRLMVEIPCG